MPRPKFKVGQTVRLALDGFGRLAAGGAYEVVRIRPFSDGEYHYFVKSRSESHERSVREGQLVA
jgi:hypothetical protein